MQKKESVKKQLRLQVDIWAYLLLGYNRINFRMNKHKLQAHDTHFCN